MQPLAPLPTPIESASVIKHPPTLLTRVTHAMWWNTVLTPFRAVVSFAANVILVRALTQDDFGAFVAVTALLSTLGFYVDIGIERSVIRFIPEVEQSHGRRGLLVFFAMVMGFKILVTVPVLAAVVLWGGLTNPVTLIFGLLLVFGAFSDMLYQYLLAYFRQIGRNTLDIVTTLLQSGLLITFILMGWGVLGALWALTIATLANVALGTAVVWRAIRDIHVRPTRAITWRSIYHRLARFSLTSYFSGFLVYVTDSAFVVLVLTYFNDTTAVALFGVAFSRVVMPVLRLIFTPLTGVQMPMFARLRANHDAAKLNEAYVMLTRLLALLLIPSAVGLALVAQPLIVLFFQARYAEAATASAVLALSLFAESLLSTAQIVLLVHDRYRDALLTRLPALVSIPLLFVLAPAYGAVGVAFAIGSARVLAQLITTVYAQRSLHLNYPFAFIARVAAASLVMAVVVGFIVNLGHAASPTDHIVRLTTSTGAGVLVFALVFKWLGGLEARDKERFLTMRIPFKQVLVKWL